jgi:putative DNA primase/helicase
MTKDKNIPHDRVADAILKNRSFLTFRDTEAIYKYDSESGLYVPGGETFIKEETEFLMSHLEHSGECTTHFVNEVIGHIKRLTYTERSLVNLDPDQLVLKNGVLDIATKAIREHTPQPAYTIGIPVTYQPEARCPLVDKFLTEVVIPENVPLLWELFGWCLDRGSTIQKLFFLLGGGANGKSKLLCLLENFLGKSNCSAVSIQSLSDSRFSMAQLDGKLANLCADLPATGIKDAAIIKGLTGGDSMQVEHKFEKPYSFRNTAKLVFSANRAPRICEDSDAIWRRLIVIDFPNQFMGDKDDIRLLEKISVPEELSGLLNKALDALTGLRQKGAFTASATKEDFRREYLLNSNPAPIFVAERCILERSASISKEDLYTSFVAFCEATGATLLTKRMFGARLNAMAIVSEGQNLWSIHEWRGIRLKDS